MAVMKDMCHALYLRDIEVLEVGRDQAAAAKEHLRSRPEGRGIPAREVEGGERPTAIEHASQTYMKGIIEYNTDEIVSSDLRGNFQTCVFDVKAGIMPLLAAFAA